MTDSMVSFSSALFYAGPAFSIGLLLSNAQVAGKIVANKSVGGLSPIPFASLFTNSLIWLYYGILKIDPVIYGPNLVGTIIGVGCIAAYESKSTVGNLPTYAAFLFICSIATWLVYYNEVETIGYVGCAMSAVNVAAPLAALPTVMKDRSTAALPLNPILMALFSSISWALYGVLIAKDPLIYGPNCIGVVFCAMQLTLFIVYRVSSKTLPQ